MEQTNKINISFSWEGLGYPLVFMLSLALLGLEFPISYFILLSILLYSFKNNKYDFLIQCTMLIGGFNYYDDNIAFPIKLADIGLLICLCSSFLHRKDKIVYRILILYAVYVIFLFFIMYMSDENFIVQFRRMRLYMFVIYFMFPLLIFSGEKFDIERLFRHLFVYVFVISIFVILDSLVFSEHFLFPRTTGGYLTYETLSFVPFSDFLRIYPAVIYIAALLIYAMMYKYNLPKWYWGIFLVALVCTKTFSVIAGFVFTWLLFLGTWSQKIKIFAILTIFLLVGNEIDKKVNGRLRINQLFEQFSIFSQGNIVLDELEELAEFGSGRGAQIIPKLELLTSTNKLLFGFGFLHDKLTSDEEYIINNEYYTDQSQAEEVATLVEVSQIQTVLDTGVIGVIVQHLFYVLIYFVIRKLKYSLFYVITLVCISIFGIGGFAGLNIHHGLILIGMTLGCILLANKSEIAT